VPNWAVVRKALPADGAAQTEEALAGSPAVRGLLDGEIQAALKDLANWEQVKNFLIVPRPFSVAAEELTVSMKVRRNVIFERYARQIEAMYVGARQDIIG
jgi:long-chain acyl-CoA synthetase